MWIWAIKLISSFLLNSAFWAVQINSNIHSSLHQNKKEELLSLVYSCNYLEKPFLLTARGQKPVLLSPDLIDFCRDIPDSRQHKSHRSRAGDTQCCHSRREDARLMENHFSFCRLYPHAKWKKGTMHENAFVQTARISTQNALLCI